MMTKAIVSVRGLLLLVVSMLALGSIVPHMALAEGQPQEKISPKVAKPMKAAQELLQKKQWDQALLKINEADQIQGKTPYDQYIINEFKTSALFALKKYAEAAPVYEQNFNSGKVPPAEVNDRLKTLVQLFTQLRNWPKVTDYGSQWLKAGNKDPDIQFAIGQAYYVQKDYRNSASVVEGAIKSAQQAGKTPEENWLQMVQSSYSLLSNAEAAKNAEAAAKDADAAAKGLEQLVRYYPKPQYWELLLRSRLQQKNTDRVQLNLYRLAVQVGVLDNPDRFVEMAEMLLEAGLPGEAKSVMEAGYQSKAFETTDKARADRFNRRMNDAKAAAAKDQQSLPAIEKEAQKSATGQGAVALGMAYSSFGQYDKGAAALAQGLQKGGVRDPDQAQIMLGIAFLKLGKKPEAAKAFEQVTSDPQMDDVARLWTIVAKSAAG